MLGFKFSVLFKYFTIIVNAEFTFLTLVLNLSVFNKLIVDSTQDNLELSLNFVKFISFILFLVLIFMMLVPEKLKYLAVVALLIMLIVGKIYKLLILRGYIFGGFCFLDWRADF